MKTLSDKHLQLLEARGICGETADRLGWHSKGNALAIPFFQAGQQVGVKYRTLDGEKKFFQEKGSAQIFYNWDALRENSHEQIIITEGELDCAIALQCGFLAVSVPNGAPMLPVPTGDTKYAYLADLPANKQVLLAVDNDNAGHNLLHDLSLRIGKHRCKWVKYPDGCKDLNDIYLKLGSAGVVEALTTARWCAVDGIYTMSELPEPPHQEAFDCTIPGCGKYYKMRGGDLAVITGIPGMGKTTFTNELMAGAAMRYGWNVGVASLEQNPKIDHRRALRTFYNSLPVHMQSDADLGKVDQWIEDKFTFFRPKDSDNVTLPWMIEKIEAAIIHNNCKLIIIDPWNEMDHDYFDSGMNLTQYTGYAVKRLKKLAAQYLIHLVVVAHPAKLSRSKDGNFPIPDLYDISDSAHWYNKPDIGMVIHRDKDGTMLFRVQKCRYIDVIGNIGEVKLKYDREKNQLNEILG